jgi:hypothetical protein
MKKIIIILLLSLIFAVGNVKAEKYALLISAQRATADDEFNNSEFWYDLFLAYEDLVIDKGFEEYDIFINYGYGRGDEFYSKYPRYRLSYHGFYFYNLLPNDTASINDNLDDIANLSTPNDTVVIRWVVGHGDVMWYDIYWAYMENDHSYPDGYVWVTDDELIKMINKVTEYNQRFIAWMTCYSGVFVCGNQRLDNEKSTIFTSSLAWEPSYAIWRDTYHAEFNYFFTGYSYGEAPGAEGPVYLDADLDGDDDVSIMELYRCTIDSVEYSNPQIGGADLDYSYISDDFYALGEYDYFAPHHIIVGGDNYNGEPTNFTINSVYTRMASKTGYILFKPGFHAQEGCEFEAKIDPTLYDDFNPLLSDANTPLVLNDNLIGADNSSDNKEAKDLIPKVFSCSQNSPNPFNIYTTIRYGLPKDSKVSLEIYNLAGQKVRTLVDANESAGYKSASWDGRTSSGAQVPQGIYFYKLQAGNDFEKTYKMVVIK